MQDSFYLLTNRKQDEEDSGNELLDRNKIKSLEFWSNKTFSTRRSSCEIWKVSISVKGEPASLAKLTRRVLNYLQGRKWKGGKKSKFLSIKSRYQEEN